MHTVDLLLQHILNDNVAIHVLMQEKTTLLSSSSLFLVASAGSTCSVSREQVENSLLLNPTTQSSLAATATAS